MKVLKVPLLKLLRHMHNWFSYTHVQVNWVHCFNFQYSCSGQKHKKKAKVEVFNFSAIHLIHDPQGKLTFPLHNTTWICPMSFSAITATIQYLLFL